MPDGELKGMVPAPGFRRGSCVDSPLTKTASNLSTGPPRGLPPRGSSALYCQGRCEGQGKTEEN